MFGGLVSGALGAVGSLIGGGIKASSTRDQMDMQRVFAQNGVRWKVEDAKRAGIHPLAALGAQTFSYNPVMVGDSGVSEALGRMGQGIDRAVEAKKLEEERQADRAIDTSVKQAQVRMLDAQADAALAQAETSRAAVARAALPPSMPKVNESATLKEPKTGRISREDAAYHIWHMGGGRYSVYWNPDFTQTIGDELGQAFNVGHALKNSFGDGVFIDPESGVSYVYDHDDGWWRRMSDVPSDKLELILGKARRHESSPKTHLERNRYRYRY